MPLSTDKPRGTLRLHIIEAALSRDTEMMGKMDPWCQVTTAYQKVRTRTMDGAGKTPKWETTFSIKVYNDQEIIKFSVFDEDVMKNDTVGEETYKIHQIMKDS